MPTPEQIARARIDRQLAASGWLLQDYRDLELSAARGIAVREFQLGKGFGAADYVLYGDGAILGVIEAKKEGDTLTGAEVQTEKYTAGIPTHAPSWCRPPPFVYQSTGTDTRFTNSLDPEPRSRPVFQFHRPETLLGWAQGLFGTASADRVSEPRATYAPVSTPVRRLQQMPPLDPTGMRPPQIQAICNLERSLAEDRRRSLVQMATGSGKTYTAVALIYRLIKFAGFRRVLFLVDRSNLARQTLREFQQYTTPDDGRKFTELYNVQHLQSSRIDPVSRVCITTIQRLYAILKGEELDPDAEEASAAQAAAALKAPVPVVYNPAVPVEMFDLVLTDECHRSIYHLWRQVLEYFDASLVGLTATPSKQTLGFFQKNLIMEYNHAQAVADGVNVDFNVYRIRTEITERGATVSAGMMVDKRDRRTRKVRWEELEEDLTYAPNELDRAVVAEDQIRTVIRTFRDRLFTEIFPGRTEVPKTLVFAKDDSHADDIVRIIREEFARGNTFCEKITYRTSTARIVEQVKGPDGQETERITYKSTGIKPEDLLSSFRNSYYPRIAVTVDMIATGTDVKPLEIVFFMRDVKSANYFEQMKGRGSRTISPDDFQIITPDAGAKDRFVIVDAVGVCEREKIDNPSLDRKPNVAFGSLLDAVSQGSTDPDTLSALASRLARLDRKLSVAQRDSLTEAAGAPFPDLIRDLVRAVDPDQAEEAAKVRFAVEEPSPEQIDDAARQLRKAAVRPLLKAKFRQVLIDIKTDNEQIIDNTSDDTLISAGPSPEAREKAKALTDSFAAYLELHKDEITAVQLLYSRRRGQRPTFQDLKQLADAIQRPPQRWTPEALWRAYEQLDQSRVRGSGKRLLTDLVSLVRFALEKDPVLAPFAETVNQKFERWISRSEKAGKKFTPQQRQWLEMIRDHVASSLAIRPDDFDSVPFNQKGGLGKAYQLFGSSLDPLLEELNTELAA